MSEYLVERLSGHFIFGSYNMFDGSGGFQISDAAGAYKAAENLKIVLDR